MSTKPTIVLVHGFWGGAAHWSKVILELSRRGYSAMHAVEMPLTSLAEDAERTRKMVAQQAGPVLLVGHSYGGAVITAMGNLPNVVGLVYIAAFAPDAGESPGGITQAHPPAAVAQKAPLADTFGNTIGEPAWKHKPSWYQLSSDDRMIAPENQRHMAQRLPAKKVMVLDASHASLVSHAAEVAGLIDEAAGYE